MNAPILALDLGSTAVKAARFTEDGQLVGQVVSVRHRGINPHDAVGFVDPHGLVDAARSAIGELSLAGVRVVATSTVWHAIVPVDSKGASCGPAVTWEARLPDELETHLRDRLASVWSHEDSGAYIHSSFPLAAWPYVVARGAATAVDLGSWVVSQLAGFDQRWPVNVASSSGLWDQAHMEWNHPALQALSLTAPPELWRDAAVDVQGIVWLPPVGDGLCHNLGESAIGNRVAITAGTSGSIRAIYQEDWTGGPANGLWAYHCEANTVVVGGAITSAGNTLEWVDRNLGGYPDWATLSPDKIAALPHADASIFGRRGPDYPWNARGYLGDLTPNVTTRDLALALGVDVWRIFARHIDALESVRGPISEVIAGGGVFESAPPLQQILADALGRDLSFSGSPQPALHGAALLGSAWLDGGKFSIDAAVQLALANTHHEPHCAQYAATVSPRLSHTQALKDLWSAK